MTALAIDPRHRQPDHELRASSPGSPSETRAQILSAWSSGPCVIALFGAAGSGRTALLEQLAASLGQAGQAVHFARRGDRAVLPEGPAILLVDEAGRMPDALLRRLFAHPGLFGVLADRPDFVERLRSLGFAAPVVHLRSEAGTEPLLLSLRRPRAAAVAAGVGAILVLASAWVLFPTREAATPPPLQRAIAAPSPAAAAAVASPEPPAALPPLPAAPGPAAAPPGEARGATPAPPVPAAAGNAAAPADPPAGAIPTVGISYAANNPMAALLAAVLTERLRKANIAAGDPVAHTDRPGVRYYFASDHEAAEATRSRNADLLAGLPLELAHAGPTTRPGQIDIALGDGRSEAVPAGDDTVVRARRVSTAPDAR